MKKIQSALISVYDKTGLDTIVKKLTDNGVIIYSTGGTYNFIEKLGLPVVSVESITEFPEILGGRVKTLHPKIFSVLLGLSNNLLLLLKECKINLLIFCLSLKIGSLVSLSLKYLRIFSLLSCLYCLK